MNDLTLATTAFDRPALFAEMIVSLLRNGTEGWHLNVAVEPGKHQQEFGQICRKLCPENSYTIHINERVLGVTENPRRSLQRCFDSGANFVLNLEDDFELAPDALSLARWYRDNHQRHWCALNLLAGPCGSAGMLSVPAHSSLLFEARTFNSIGVGFTRLDWERVSQFFQPSKIPLNHSAYDLYDNYGWDWGILMHLLKNPQLRTVQPVAARCTHRGAEGTYCTQEFQDRAFGRLAISNGVNNGFQMTDAADLPPEVMAHIHSQNESMEYLQKYTLADRNGPIRAWTERAVRRWKKIVKR